MDCPDASQFTPERNASVTALQALAMLNDRFIVRQCEHFAARVAGQGGDIPSQVEAAYLLALGRPPDRDEAEAIAAYATRHGMANACRPDREHERVHVRELSFPVAPGVCKGSRRPPGPVRLTRE